MNESIEYALYNLGIEYKKTQAERQRYECVGGVKNNEVVFDVGNINGTDARGAISRALKELEEMGLVESYWIAGVGEGSAFFSESGLKLIDDIIERKSQE